MAKWKYAKEKKTYSTQFLKFEEGKPKEIEVENWSFERAAAGYLFKCYVVKEDGESVDKIWCVWDFDSAEALKKKLGAKYTAGTKELKVTMKLDEDEQQTFEFA